MPREPRHKKTKIVNGSSWEYFDSYSCIWAKYELTCPENRTCQVGGGYLWRGEPMGDKRRFSGFFEFLALGLGNIHVRVDDGKGPCEVTVYLRDLGTTGGA